MTRQTVCTVEECEKPSSSRGLCVMHYARLRRHGNVQAKAPHPRLVDISNERFGRLTAIEIVGKARPDGGPNLWRCVCDCGEETRVSRTKLSSGHTRSCGCLIDAGRRARAKHRMTNTAEYRAWAGIKSRCNDPANKRYEYYGARGVKVHPEWDAQFLSFYEHIGPRPTPRHSVDRIDNDGNYEPGNVRWADMKTQRANRRDSR